MAITTGPLLGVFDTEQARLIGITQNGGTPDITYFAGQDTPTPAGAVPVVAETNLVTGGVGKIEVAGKESGIVHAGINGARRIGSRSLTGRGVALALSDATFPANSNTAGLTIHNRLALADGFDAVRLIIPNMHTSGVSVKANLGVSAALGAYSTPPTANGNNGFTSAAPTCTEPVNSSGGAYLNVTKDASTTLSLPAAIDASNLCPSYTPTDWMPITDIDRTDDGALPLLDVRLEYAAGSVATIANTGGTYASWAMWGVEGGFAADSVWRAWAQASQGVTTPANFSSQQTVPYFVPVIVQYRSKNGVITVVEFGDSIWDGGAGPTYTGDSFGWRAVKNIRAAGHLIERCSLSVPGGSTQKLVQIAQQVGKYIGGSVWMCEASSVNNVGATLTKRLRQHALGSLGCFANLSYERAVPLVTATMWPVAYAAAAWGATDALRLSLNAELLANAENGGYRIMDIAPLINGTAHASGQMEPAAGYVLADGKHLNDAAHDLTEPAYRSAVMSAVGI